METAQVTRQHLRTAPAQGLRILILDYDLYGSVGGGQSVYQRLIALRPQDTFYYLRRWEPEDAVRPVNAVGIPYLTLYRLGSIGRPRKGEHAAATDDDAAAERRAARTGQRPRSRQPNRLPRTTEYLSPIYVQCRNIAASIRQHLDRIDFDAVDAPDYNQLGLFIRPALQAEGIRAGSVVLALHGTLSMAFRAGWPTGMNDAPYLAEMRAREQLQYRAADARYAISTSYAEQWQRQAGLDVQTIDPLNMITDMDPAVLPASTEAPDLAFLGRREKWKGPDLFLDLAWCLDPASYRRLLLIGPDGPNRIGQGSADTLAAMARVRGLQPQILGSRSRAAVDALFHTRTLLLLPSRHDTFNLTALEAIVHGCPAIVSDQSGFAAWLRSRMPELGWLVADIGCSRIAAAQTAAVLQDYDGSRSRLAEALSRHRLDPDVDGLRSIYRPAGHCDPEARQSTVDMATHFELQMELVAPSRLRSLAFASLGPATTIGRSIAPYLPSGLQQSARTAGRFLRAMWRDRRHGVRGRAREQLKDAIRRLTGASARTFVQIDRSRMVGPLRKYVVMASERRRRDVTVKIDYLAGLIPQRLPDRVRLFRELVRLERRVGRELIAATYAVRIMRWLGNDTYGDLPFVQAVLQQHGFPKEAEAVAAMFGGAPDSFDRCLDLMQSAYAEHRTKPDLPLAMLDDRRGDATPRVAVIVSLYNAAEKLPTLLTMLYQQTLARRGEMEVVLVDSGSPADERGAFTAFAERHDLPMVYARSQQRETIQAAWNRGIKLSRAPYLCFLGADEGLHPDALRQLAAALDADAGVDWAIADSVVTNVDRRGVFDADVMTYDRRGYRQDLVYLETCYLSWVGGLYRRTIHDRFGWYDESFRAAGDTEFKCRVMPHIRSVHLPALLGVFNNYPEERTTAHPRAELEDIRAWYLWRTVAGMHYGFANRPATDAARLLQDSVNYRKSFCAHLSTDYDLANALAEYLASRPDAPAWAQRARPYTVEALALVRNIDLLPGVVPTGPRGVARAWWLHNRLRAVRQMAQRHRTAFDLTTAPHYEIFNDNRYEQHWYSWSAF